METHQVNMAFDLLLTIKDGEQAVNLHDLITKVEGLVDEWATEHNTRVLSFIGAVG